MRSLVVVDAHVHFLDPARLGHPWLEHTPELARERSLEAFEQERGPITVERLVLVEAACAPGKSDAETRWLCELADSDARIAAIVAFAQLELGARVEPALDALQERRAVRGVRRLLQDDPDEALCTREDFVAGVRLAAERGFVFDACIRHGQLEHVVELARRVPEAVIVLDHLGKPDVAGGELDPWRARLAELAALPNTWTKLSGLVTEARSNWAEADFAPFVEHALEVFGPSRIVFGSDWPLVELAAGYERWSRTAESLLAPFGAEVQRAVLHDNALRLYCSQE